MADKVKFNLTLVLGKDEIEATMQDIRNQLDSGETSCIAVRVFSAEGTWKDVVLGDDDKERATALVALHAAIAKAH